jgi:glycosyltransferase involved in cell wall biosynthesis
MFQPRARYTRDWSGSVAILAPGPLPTVDYYVSPRLRALPERAVHQFDSRTFDSVAEALPAGTFFIIVRHAGAGWLRWLAAEPARWSGVAYLMDDDIPGAWACRELPLDYRLWTSGRYAWVRRSLEKVCDRVWVSNNRLQARYAVIKPQVLPPLEPFAPRSAAPRGNRRWTYLGTRIHQQEIKWLLPIVAAVQARSPDYEFYIFGDKKIEKWFIRIPRVNVLSPRPWPEFASHCQSSEIAVGVAPLLPGRFNAMRSEVKVFDITRCGATGIFTQVSPYVPALKDVAAALLPNDPAAWVDAIISLLEDDDRRMACFASAAAWVERAGSDVDLIALIRDRVY